MKKILFSGFILIFSIGVFAKVSSKRKLASTKQKIEAMTIYGDSVSQFKIEDSDGKFLITMFTSAGIRRQRVLTKADFDFILNEYANLPVPLQVPTDCYRARMDVILYKDGSQESKKSSCFGLQTLTEPQYVHFSKVLVNAL